MQKNWRFTLIDRNGTATVIEEPGGWDKIAFSLKRNRERHGLFNEISSTSFEYKRTAARLLRQEYEAYMAQGNMTLQIEGRTRTGFKLFYTGQVSFGDSYGSKYAGGNYTVSATTDQIGPYVDLVNRWDQAVDLTNPKCFDGVTDLAAYPLLNFPMSLPSKAIFLQNKAMPTEGAYDVRFDIDFAGNVHNSQVKGVIIPKFDDVKMQEITDFTPGYQFDYLEFNTQTLKQALTGQQQLTINPKEAIVGANLYNFDIVLQGTFTVQYQGTGSGSYKISVAVNGYSDMRQIIAPVLIEQVSAISNAAQGLHTHVTNINYSFNQSLTLNRNDLYVIYFIVEFTHATTDNSYIWNSIKIELDKNTSHFIVGSYTKAAPTDAQVFMLNESISRVIEAVTNNQLRLKSEYLGRTDSQPFSFPQNGCGANRILTNGLAIRRIIFANSANTGVFTSMKDCFSSLKATDNVGIGLEGSNIRIEPWQYFYQNQVILTCRNINKIERKVQKEEIYSTFKFGYDKWEAEDSNGLDDFFTKREYRLDISSISNTLEQICKFIASGYAIEVTRRKGSDSADWRYDKDIFMICVTPSGSSYVVELGNISNASNIIDPPTIYNFRISPLRNAFRWFPTVIGSYRNVNTGHRIVFGSGDANYKAAGQLTTLDCTLEAGVLAENQDLNLTVFADQLNGLPIMWPERVPFTYPLGMQQYQYIVANPYGLIEFSSPTENGAGWIDQIDYRANDGEADFTLIPKIV